MYLSLFLFLSIKLSTSKRVKCLNVVCQQFCFYVLFLSLSLSLSLPPLSLSLSHTHTHTHEHIPPLSLSLSLSLSHTHSLSLSLSLFLSLVIHLFILLFHLSLFPIHFLFCFSCLYPCITLFSLYPSPLSLARSLSLSSLSLALSFSLFELIPITCSFFSPLHIKTENIMLYFPFSYTCYWTRLTYFGQKMPVGLTMIITTNSIARTK